MSLMPQWFAGAPQNSTLPKVPFLRYMAGQQARNFAPTALGMRVPSAQRYRKLAPSEQQGFAGYLQDEMGTSAQDVFWLMNKLRPQGAVGMMPRWVR